MEGMWPFTHGKSHAKVGIDIGTSAVKIVALSPKGGKSDRFVLENYGAAMSISSLQRNDKGEAANRLSDEEIVKLVKMVLDEMKIGNMRTANISIPVYASFITEVVLPKMSVSELNTAISYQAKQYVPISVSEVELDWQVIEETPLEKSEETGKKEEEALKDKEKPTEELHVLLAAVPKDTIERQQYIAKQIGMKVEAMEIETFSLVRSILGQKKGVVCMVDMGARNTNITIIADGFIRINRNIDVGGGELTHVIAQSMGIDYSRAEEIKRIQGLVVEGGEHEIVETMYPVLGKILVEVERVLNAYKLRQHRDISEVVLVGGTSQLQGVASYFGDKLRLPITLGNPWNRVEYPGELKQILDELAPSFGIALGLAMR